MLSLLIPYFLLSLTHTPLFVPFSTLPLSLMLAHHSPLILLFTEKKLSSSQTVLVAHTRSKGTLQLSKLLNGDKKKIKCNYCKKKDHIKSECWKLKADQAAKKEKSGERKDSGNKDLIVKVAVAKADKGIIQLFKAEILTGQKNILSKWIVDSGASTHMSSQWKWFITYEKLLEPHWVWLEDEHFILAVRTGWVWLTVTVNGHNSEYILLDVYHVPSLNWNLLLVSALNQYGYSLSFANLWCQLMKLEQVIAMAHEENNLYILNASPFIPGYAYIVMTNDINTFIKSANVPIYHALIASTNSATSTTAIWHYHLSHIMLQSVKMLFQQSIMKGMHITDSNSHDSGTCKACLEGKQI